MKHKLRIGDAVVVKRERKRKAETPFEPHIYIITEIKSSTIHAKRLNDGKTFCRDASKFKLLRTAKLAAASDQPEEAPARRLTIPPAAPTQARKPTQTTEPEPTTHQNPSPAALDKGDTTTTQTATYRTTSNC